MNMEIAGLAQGGGGGERSSLLLFFSSHFANAKFLTKKGKTIS